MQNTRISLLATFVAALCAPSCDTVDDQRLADPPVPEEAGLPDVPTHVEQACHDFCDDVGEACNPRCYRGCVESYDFYPSCQDAQLAYLACVRDNFVNCHTVPAACSAEDYELHACKGCTDGGLGRLDEEQSCNCRGESAGADARVQCQPNALGELECLCEVDGMELRTCVETNVDSACRAIGGCCEGTI